MDKELEGYISNYDRLSKNVGAKCEYTVIWDLH